MILDTYLREQIQGVQNDCIDPFEYMANIQYESIIISNQIDDTLRAYDEMCILETKIDDEVPKDFKVGCKNVIQKIQDILWKIVSGIRAVFKKISEFASKIRNAKWTWPLAVSLKSQGKKAISIPISSYDTFIRNEIFDWGDIIKKIPVSDLMNVSQFTCEKYDSRIRTVLTDISNDNYDSVKSFISDYTEHIQSIKSRSEVVSEIYKKAPTKMNGFITIYKDQRYTTQFINLQKQVEGFTKFCDQSLKLLYTQVVDHMSNYDKMLKALLSQYDKATMNKSQLPYYTKILSLLNKGMVKEANQVSTAYTEANNLFVSIYKTQRAALEKCAFVLSKRGEKSEEN